MVVMSTNIQYSEMGVTYMSMKWISEMILILEKDLDMNVKYEFNVHNFKNLQYAAD